MLNRFIGISTKTLESRLENLENRLEELRKSIDDGEELGGGSPLEHIYDEIDDLADEIVRREIESNS
jgi:hypothetical protein